MVHGMHEMADKMDTGKGIYRPGWQSACFSQNTTALSAWARAANSTKILHVTSSADTSGSADTSARGRGPRRHTAHMLGVGAATASSRERAARCRAARQIYSARS